MLSMWEVDFVPIILAKIATTPTLILTLILILYAILESLCHVSHLAICRLWVLSTVVSIQQVEITRSILFTEISCRLQLALLFGPGKYFVGESRGGYIQLPQSPVLPRTCDSMPVCLAHCQPYFYLMKYILVQLAFISLCFYTQSKNFWMDDVYFGRQRVAGCNPTVIRLCKEIPPG